jgi:predicted nucleic acid-binding protein
LTATLVDTNVLFDYLSEDEDWFDWSASMLAQAFEQGAIVINPIIFAELSVRYDEMEALDRVLPDTYFTRAALPWEAAFLAAKAFSRYKRRGGAKSSPLPDFLIGAHAAVTGMTLLSRDARRYRTYFPKLKILAP